MYETAISKELQIPPPQRETKRSRLVLSPGDFRILGQILEHRFLRREQISALTGRHEKRVHRRLFKLGVAGYLAAIRRPQQKHIYRLLRSGLAALVARGLASGES